MTKELSSFEYGLLALFVFSNSAIVLVGRYSRVGTHREDLYSVNHMIVTIELVKFALSSVGEYYWSEGDLLTSIHEHVVRVGL